MSGITRDFSQQSVQELRDIIRKNLQDNQWGFFDWFDDTFLMQELNIKNYINNVNEYHAKMIDKHNMGSAEFDRILQRVHAVDENYSARINSLVDQAKALQTRIEQLTKMIDPSVITANPGDFARLADGIDSKYQKVKVQSEAKMKQCEASMPVLYDKQWYENVVDSIKAGVNVAGQVGEGIGCGLVDVAKDLVFGVKDTAVGLFHYLANNPQEENALFIANIYVQSKKQNKPVPQFLWDSLTTGIWNGLQTTADDFAKGDLKTKSEMATRVLGNLALFLIPATDVAKVGEAGEAVELGGKVGSAAELAGDLPKIEKGTEALKDIPEIEKEGEAIEGAEKAAGETAETITGEADALKEVICSVDDLSSTQVEALRKYTGYDYVNINNSLRGLEPLHEDNVKTVFIMKSALGKASLPEDMTLYRGSSTEALGSLKNLSPEKLIGRTFTESGFMSTSTESQVAQQTFSGNLQIKIEALQGAHGLNISSISQFHDESEVLFNAGQEMLITDAQKRGEITYISVILQ